MVNHKLKPSFCFSLPLQTNFISVQWFQCIAALTSFKILKNWINCPKYYILSSVNDHQFIKLDTCDEGKAIKSWTCCSEIRDCSGLWLVKREPRRNFLNYSLLTIFRILRFTIWTHFNRCEITPFVVLIFVIQPSPSSGYQSPVQSRHISASTRCRYLFNLHYEKSWAGMNVFRNGMNVFRNGMNSFQNGMNSFRTGMKSFRIDTGIWSRE